MVPPQVMPSVRACGKMVRDIIARSGADEVRTSVSPIGDGTTIGAAQAEIGDQSGFQFAADAGGCCDRDLDEAALAGLAQDPVDPLSRDIQPLRDGVLGLAFLEIMPADPRHHGGVDHDPSPVSPQARGHRSDLSRVLSF